MGVSMGLLLGASRRGITGTDVQQLASAVPGITAFYDTRYNVTQGAGVVTAWDDARGAAGFGPQLVGQKGAGAFPAWDNVNKIITFDGVQNWMNTAVDAALDMSAGHSVIYVGTLPGGNFPLTIGDAAVSKFFTLCTQAAQVQSSNSFGPCFTPVAVGATRRLGLLSYNPADYYGSGVIPVSGALRTMVLGRVGRNSAGTAAGGYLMGAGAAAGGWQLWLGNYASQFTANAVRAVLVLNHPVTGSELVTIAAWAAANHAYVTESSVTRMVFFDGNSLTAGQGASAGNDYPSRVMASAGFTVNCDYVNAAVSGLQGVHMVDEFPDRVGPAFVGSYAKKVYVCWELTNDLSISQTAAQAAAHVQSLCQQAKALGATACIAVTCIPRNGFSGAQETARLAANAAILALPSGIDAVADVAAIPSLQNTADVTYFQADGVHLTDAGYNLVATDATKGVAVTTTPYL